MQVLSGNRQSLKMFLSAIFENPKRYAVRAEIRPRDPMDKAQRSGTAFSQINAIRQSMIPTTLHIKPASAISKYLDTAGLNFSRFIASFFMVFYLNTDGQPASISTLIERKQNRERL